LLQVLVGQHDLGGAGAGWLEVSRNDRSVLVTVASRLMTAALFMRVEIVGAETIR
jgi:hypothetical protein